MELAKSVLVVVDVRNGFVSRVPDVVRRGEERGGTPSFTGRFVGPRQLVVTA